MTARGLSIWCVLAGAVLVASFLHYLHIHSGLLHLLELNRWVHFAIYAAVVAVPFGLWQRAPGILASIAPVTLAIAVDFLASDPSFNAVRPQTIQAELFGVAAGILLGLNLRVMRKAQVRLKTGTQKPSTRAAL